MEITYKPVGVNETAEWGDYDHLMQRWEGLGKSMAKNLIREMRDNKDFQKYVFNPTHKLVFINYEGFKSFIEWKTRNRFKQHQGAKHEKQSLHQEIGSLRYPI